MWFAYRYIPHQMEKMQTFIDFIFFEVWCKAPLGAEYGLDLFAENSELHEVMTAFHYSDSEGAEFFAGHVERIYLLFRNLTPEQVEELQRGYRGNNDIEKICANDAAIVPMRYSDMPPVYHELAEQLGSFFKGLYSSKALTLKDLRNKIGKIGDHYKSFISINTAGKCPFCGISDLKGRYHTKRDAYDHYFPKDLYPFNTINFRNLVPACNDCNSPYKHIKDPAHNQSGRRKAFNPYAASREAIQMRIELQRSDPANLKPDDITLEFGPLEVREELDTWKEVYGIEERYKAKLCGESDGRAWLVQVLEEWREDGRSPDEFMEALNRQAERRPYADCNFLKLPFLEACRHAGLF